jgi:TetR/AcrR family transcriptional repressor of nem operon
LLYDIVLPAVNNQEAKIFLDFPRRPVYLYPMIFMDKKIRRLGRPPKETAGHSETRESLLRAGVEILTEKGFSSTGIDVILRRVGVPKGSFYHFFSNKEAFGAELVERYADYFASKLDRFLLDNTMSPLQRLRAFTNDAKCGMARHEFSRGCLVGNLGQEMGTLPESFRDQLKAVFQDWQSRVASCLEEAKAVGEISSTSDCQQLAATFWIGWEGAILRAKLERSPDALDLFSDFFLTGLQK